ncbi:CopG family transcriptional regulator [Bacillus mycoides]|uniref:CopG family transcriptional regulator n=1 Tax=Bacillus mycoides TaxID=1405 RepID=UPI003CFF09AA
MEIQEVIKALRTKSAKAVAKEIGISDKTLSKALKNAGYAYESKGHVGWHYTGQGEAPLKEDIREFIAVADDTQVETADDVLTKKDISGLRKMQSEWVSIKNAINTLMQEKEKRSAQKNTSPIHLLHEHIRESGSKEKVSRTVNLGKETCLELGSFEDTHRFNRDDIIEAALREFFKKYKA